MSNSIYQTTIKMNAEGEFFLEIPDDMWETLTHCGWHIGDDLEYEANLGQIKIINASAQGTRRFD